MKCLALVTLVVLSGCAASTNAGGIVSPSTTVTPSIVGSAGTASASAAATVTPFSTNVRPSPTPTYTGSRTLVESDSGATVDLKLGEILRISLPSEYDTPNAQSDVMARRSSTGGYPSGKPLEASFQAERAGRTDITSTTDYACLHAQPMCMIPQREWIVHVVVS